MKSVYIPELKAQCYLVSSYADLRKQGDVRAIVKEAYLNPLSIEVKLSLLRKLFHAPERVWETLEMEENHEQLWRLMQHLDWVWKGPEVRPFASIRIKGKDYFLPDEDLQWLSTAEFVIATAHLIGFWTGGGEVENAQSMGKFLATIIRPKPDILHRKNNRPDPREEYDSTRCERRYAGLIGRIDVPTQVLVAQWFNNAANRMLMSFGFARPKQGDESALIEQGIFVQDWERQVVKVAESQVFGSYDGVMARPIQDVLSYIELKNDEMRNKPSYDKE
jgi:hypothetical protein